METTFKRRVTNICVFCGSNSGSKPEFMEVAKELGRVIAERNMHLVYDGGNLGLMGCVSKAVQEYGSHVLGIIPKPLADTDLIGDSNGEECILLGMSEQLIEMVNHADTFIALPGWLGMLEEIFTVASRDNLNIHQKPIGLFNVDGFFDFLFVFLADANKLGLISKPVKDIFLNVRKADELIDQLLAYEPKIDPIVSKLNWSNSNRGKKRKLDLDLNR